MLCNRCGGSNENDAAFCVNCGESLSKPQKVKKLLSKRLSRARSLLRKAYLLETLFDVSFEHMVSFKTIKWIYGLSILSAGLIALLLVVAGFRVSPLLGVFTVVVGAPLIFLLITLYSRVLLEMILVNFRKVGHQTKTDRLPEPTDDIEWNV